MQLAPGQADSLGGSRGARGIGNTRDVVQPGHTHPISGSDDIRVESGRPRRPGQCGYLPGVLVRRIEYENSGNRMQVGGDCLDERQVLRGDDEQCGPAVVDRVGKHASAEFRVRRGIDRADTGKAQPQWPATPGPHQRW